MAMEKQLSANVLVVDDDPDMARAIADALESAGQRCAIVGSGAAALEACSAHAFGVVISDVRMDGMDGLELMERLQQAHGDLPVVLLTGAGSIPAAVDAVKRGAAQYIVKPADRFELQQAVARVLARASNPPSSTPAPTAAPAFVGSGSVVTALRKRIELVAAATSPVLIQGETGTG
ncbi:MAG: sigma-54-dependent Fis family transcriptional regulator, partial [Myxococcaceae bacterium]|nr:sigma-54-dependent Fis family transcriptional regulator [Myxococcaceae bacterium]